MSEWVGQSVTKIFAEQPRKAQHLQKASDPVIVAKLGRVDVQDVIVAIVLDPYRRCATPEVQAGLSEARGFTEKGLADSTSFVPGWSSRQRTL